MRVCRGLGHRGWSSGLGAAGHGRSQLVVGVERLDDAVRDRAEVRAASQRRQRLPVVPGEPLVEPGQPPGDGGGDLGVLVAEADELEQGLQALVRLALQRLDRLDQGVSVTPTASTTMNRSFCLASSVTAWKSVSSMTRTPRPSICSK